VDSRCSPKHVHPTHGLDQIASFLRDTGSSSPAMTNLPSPGPTESLTVPGDCRFWFNNDESRTPARPQLGEPHPQAPIRATENKPLCVLSSLKHDELMAKGDDLGLNCGLSAKAPEEATEHH
jgi:hypothetical protein